MPVCCVKRGERPRDSCASNAAIYHWIFPDIRGVIETDELMPDYLRINRKRHYRQPEHDEEIRSRESCIRAQRNGVSSPGFAYARSFSLSRCAFCHAAF